MSAVPPPGHPGAGSGNFRTRLVVLFGGQSAEHDISRITAAHVLAAVDPDRYDVVPVGITTDGRWMLAEGARAALAEGRPLGDRLAVKGPSVRPDELATTTTVGRPERVAGGSDIEAAPPERTVVLPLLHGPMGEDGTVQGLLELAGVAYAGAGVLGSAVCMDKAMAKVVTGAAGIPQGAWLEARADEVEAANDALAKRVDAELGWPAFVKPANLGSSVGISRAGDPAELVTALAAALAYDDRVVIEEAIDAREIEVGVLGNEDPRASVPGEIVPTHDFYDYEDKYEEGAAEMVIPAELTDDVTDEVRRLAVRAFVAQRAEGFARVDFFYEAEGRDGGQGRGLLLNEINTIPGFTPYSMFPSLWEATGLGYAELIDELVRLALDRQARRDAHRSTDR